MGILHKGPPGILGESFLSGVVEQEDNFEKDMSQPLQKYQFSL